MGPDVVIVHSDTCPKCEKAIEYYTRATEKQGGTVRLYKDMDDIDMSERVCLMANLQVNNGDDRALPLIWVNGKYVSYDVLSQYLYDRDNEGE